jgi:hypothetical protein
MGKHDDQRDHGPQLSDGESGIPNLGHEVYRRYSVDPGIARSTSGFGLGESLARFALDRVGLLDEIQPRWKTANSRAVGGPQVDRMWSASRSPFGAPHPQRSSAAPLLARMATPGAVPVPPTAPSSSEASTSSSSVGAPGITPIQTLASRTIQRSVDSSDRSADQAGTTPSATSNASPSAGIGGTNLIQTLASRTVQRSVDSSNRSSDPVGTTSSATSKDSASDSSIFTPAFNASLAGQQSHHVPSNEPSGGIVMRSSANAAQTIPQAPLHSTVDTNSDMSSRPQTNPSTTEQHVSRSSSNEPQQGIAMRSRDSRVTPEATPLPTAERPPVIVQPPILSRAARRSAQLQRQPQREETVHPVSESAAGIQRQSVQDLPIIKHTDHGSSHVNQSSQDARAESRSEVTRQAKAPLYSDSTGSPGLAQATAVGAEQFTSARAESAAKPELHSAVQPSVPYTKSNSSLPIVTPIIGHADPVWRKPKDVSASSEAPSPEDLSKAASSSAIPEEMPINRPSHSPGSSVVAPLSSLVQTPSPVNILARSSAVHPQHQNEQIKSTETPPVAAAPQPRDESHRMIARVATQDRSMNAVADSHREIIAPTQPVWRTPTSAPTENFAAPSMVAGHLPSESIVARKTSVSSDSSQQSEITRAPEIEENRPLPRVSAEFAANPEAPEIRGVPLHRTIGNQSVGRLSASASPDSISAVVLASPKSALQRSSTGPVRTPSEYSATQLQPLVPSSPVVIKRLPMEAEGPSAPIHRSADLRSTSATGTASRAPSVLNDRIDFTADTVHRVGAGGSFNGPSTSTAGSSGHSTASYTANLMVQRSTSPTTPVSNSTVSPAPAPAPTQSANANQPVSPAVNITQLANRVYDLLVRRLASEQQRRGA